MRPPALPASATLPSPPPPSTLGEAELDRVPSPTVDTSRQKNMLKLDGRGIWIMGEAKRLKIAMCAHKSVQNGGSEAVEQHGRGQFKGSF